MVEYKLDLPQHQNVVWLPKALVATLGRSLRIVPNDLVAVVYKDGANMDEVVRSLRLLEQHFSLKADRERAR